MKPTLKGAEWRKVNVAEPNPNGGVFHKETYCLCRDGLPPEPKSFTSSELWVFFTLGVMIGAALINGLFQLANK